MTAFATTYKLCASVVIFMLFFICSTHLSANADKSSISLYVYLLKYATSFYVFLWPYVHTQKSSRICTFC